MESNTTQPIEMKRVIFFLIFAFGIAWATAYVIYRNGGLANGPMLAPGIPLALLLLAGPYMFAPTIAHVLTRLLTREGWSGTTLWPRFRHAWKYYLLAWVLPGILTVIGGACFFVFFPHLFDPALTLVTSQNQAVGGLFAGLQPWQMMLAGTLLGIALAPINLFATFGEEFGWRAYLLQKLLPLGRQNALVLMGLIWGVWHWPVIFMGYEYGSAYPGWPWAGPLLFIWVTFGLGTFLAWVALRSGSVWPAALGHAAINAIAGLSLMVLVKDAQYNPMLGPTPVGIFGGLGFTILAIALYLKEDAWQQVGDVQPTQIEDHRD